MSQKKECKHTKTIGYPPICFYCKKPVKEFASGVKHQKDLMEPGYKVKMGYELQDPRIKKAEELKRKLKVVNSRLEKKSLLPFEKQKILEEKKEVEAEMRSLQGEFDY